MGRTKIELSLTPEQMQEFFLRLSQCKGGATGPAVQALAEEFGVKISHDAANNFRKGPLEDYLKRLERNAQKARELVELAKANVPTSKANEVKLGMAISDKLDAEIDEMSIEDLDRASRINERLRASEDRSTNLERLQRETVAKLEIAEQRERVERERADKLEREKTEWHEKREKAKAAIAQVTKKAGLGADTRRIIEEALAKELDA